jgi:hypothetical protein
MVSLLYTTSGGIAMTRLVGVIIGASFLLCSSAIAQTSIDVEKMTCEQFNAFRIADPERIAIWLSGYYHGTRKDPVLQVQSLQDNYSKVREFCFENRKRQLLDAVQRVLRPTAPVRP